MARELQDFVEAVIQKGSFPDNSTLLRIYIQKLVLGMHVYGTESIERLADDIIVELEYFNHVPKQPKRKTNRYFSTPIRLETEKEQYVFDLAKKCIAAYGKSVSLRTKLSSHKRARGGEQDDFASDFLANKREQGTLKHNVQQSELLSMIRRINAQKATPSRRRKKAREERAAKKALETGSQPTLL